MNFKFNLPWDYEIIAYVQFTDEDAWIITKHDHHHTPYVLHTTSTRGEQRDCFWGHYFKTREEALAYLAEKLELAFGDALLS